MWLLVCIRIKLNPCQYKDPTNQVCPLHLTLAIICQSHTPALRINLCKSSVYFEKNTSMQEFHIPQHGCINGILFLWPVYDTVLQDQHKVLTFPFIRTIHDITCFPWTVRGKQTVDYIVTLRPTHSVNGPYRVDIFVGTTKTIHQMLWCFKSNGWQNFIFGDPISRRVASDAKAR